MKLIHKLLVGYFIVTLIIGGFSTMILLYNLNKNIDNLSVYREREVKSFVKVIDAMIPSEKSLENIEPIQSMFTSVSQSLPHIKRITLHGAGPKTHKYVHLASNITEIIGTPSHPEDIDAINNNKTTILYESSKNQNFIDITHPIHDINGIPIASLGIAIALDESDEVLQRAITTMKKDTIFTILLSLVLATMIALMASYIISRRIISPIEKLKSAAESITDKKEYKNIEIEDNDEVGELADSFNTMSNELKHLHESMEEQILSKTEELKSQYLIDNLTQLPSRQALLADIAKLKKFGLAILDISSFKDINDVYGIDIGNQVLIELSKRYVSYLHGTKLQVYRISGDEVAIVNPKVMEHAEFIKQIGTIIQNVEHDTLYFPKNDLEIDISIHAGVSCESHLALEKANIALIKAKKQHIDFSIFEESDYKENKQESNLNMITKIKTAIQEYNFKAYYQPIVDADHNIIKYEALVRMEDKDKILPPSAFLDIAIKSKFYKDITRLMIFQALHDFEHSDKMVSINICADDLLNTDTKNFIIHQLENYPRASKVVFELLESEDLSKVPDLKEFISTIKKLGVKIAIDDFGAGYSNFSYILHLEPDYLKIDGSLIANIDTDKKSYEMVDMIITFAHSLKITVIAEFVHSKEVLDICRSLKIDEFQGYYFGEPSKTIQA